MSALISMTNIQKVYPLPTGQVIALDNINFTLNKGEFTAIIGPSGSGKSTLMNMIGCLDLPSGGSYFLDGVDVCALGENDLAQIRNHKIGFIFQQFNLLPRLSALENVELPLVYQGIGANERRARAVTALSRVGLNHRLTHRPGELSGGQQQRVAIARALVTETPLILADEPTGNLDSKSGREVLHMLQELYQSGRTVLLITHDAGVAAHAKRRIIIEDGRIISDDGIKPHLIKEGHHEAASGI